jgi:hypothetical protein
MAASTTVYKPNMAALEGHMGRSIYETVRDAPTPDWDKLNEQSRIIEQNIVEALKHAKP